MLKHLKISIFILGLTAVNSSDAQMKIQYGISTGCSLQYRALSFDKNNDELGINQLIVDSRERLEKVDFRPRIGFDFKLNFNNKIGLKSGVSYDLKGYKTKGDFYSLTSGGAVLLFSFVANEFSHCIGVPTLFSMKIPFTKNTMEINFGATHNFYIGSSTFSKQIFPTETVKDVTSGSYGNGRYIGQGAIELNFLFVPFANNNQLYIGSDFKFGYNSISGQTPIKEYIFSTGINMGFTFGKKE
jgi:hypothetical protein